MWRIAIVILVAGGFLIYTGVQEYRVSSGASSAPLAIELAALERNPAPESSHLQVGEHVAVYGATVCTYEKSKYDYGTPKPSATVTYAYYPIISNEHPFLVRLRELREQYGDAEIPEAEVPSLESFTVLVKTKKFKTFGSIPDEVFAHESGVQGLLINRIAALDSEDKRLLRQNFPKVDFDRILILEAGRRPSSPLKSLGLIAGGLLVILGGPVGLYLFSRRRGATVPTRRSGGYRRFRSAPAGASPDDGAGAGPGGEPGDGPGAAR